LFHKKTLILNRESTLILKLYQQSRGKQQSQLQDVIDMAGNITCNSEDCAVSVDAGARDDRAMWRREPAAEGRLYCKKYSFNYVFVI
jgi:hypothetical protein